jgi:hypothetical protein
VSGEYIKWGREKGNVGKRKRKNGKEKKGKCEEEKKKEGGKGGKYHF